MYSADETYTDADGVFDDVTPYHDQAPAPFVPTDEVFVYGILLADAETPAVLPGHRLVFANFATIEPADGEFAYGALVPVDDARLRDYDRVEGYRPWDPASSYYLRKRVTVIVGNETQRVWAYEMNEASRANARPLVPPHLYASMIRAYRDLGMPQEAYDALVRLVA